MRETALSWFRTYLEDRTHCVQIDSKHPRLFRYRVVWKRVETARRLTECFGEVGRWMAVRMLKLNDEKTKMMIFTSKHHLKVCGGCSLTVDDDTVSPSHRIRNLGVHMDQHLTMTDHVTAVCSACNYHLYRLSSIRHYLTTEAAKSAVNALVTSRLDYCNSLLHNIPLSQTARLQRVQNNAARLIYSASVAREEI